MSSLILLFVCLMIGVGLQKVKAIPSNAPSTLGTIILFVPLPAVCLLFIPHLEWSIDLIPLALVTWIVFGVAYFLFTFLGKKLNWDKGLIGCMILTAGFCNSSFVGFPVVEALLGKEALKHALFLDQSGSFLIVSSFGIWIALTFSAGEMKKRVLFKKILLFPPFIGFIAGIILNIFGWQASGVTKEVLEKLAALLTPMALILVGLQLRWGEIRHEAKYLMTGLSYKLIFAPLIVFCLYSFIGIDKRMFEVAVLESAMAPMITASILAATHNLRPKLAGLMVGIGVPVSFLTLGLWFYLLKIF